MELEMHMEMELEMHMEMELEMHMEMEMEMEMAKAVHGSYREYRCRARSTYQM